MRLFQCLATRGGALQTRCLLILACARRRKAGARGSGSRGGQADLMNPRAHCSSSSSSSSLNFSFIDSGRALHPGEFDELGTAGEPISRPNWTCPAPSSKASERYVHIVNRTTLRPPSSHATFSRTLEPPLKVHRLTSTGRLLVFRPNS